MDPVSSSRLFGYEHAFDHPVSVIVVIIIGVALAITPLCIYLLAVTGRITPEHRRELVTRYLSWLVIAPVLLVPVLLGAAWTIALVGVLSLLCYREYARATGLFREKAISLVVVAGIALLTFSVADHWYGLFVAAAPLTMVVIASVTILSDRPKGYIQRVALAVLGYALFGVCLAHLGYFANDVNYRPMLLGLVFCVQINDVFAYISGKTFGRHKLAPLTSPNKTIEGSIGAIILTTTLIVTLGRWGLGEQQLAQWHHLIALGLIVSIGGQLGDLMLSSIKRDLDLKDIGNWIPGHGGLLDRFDSMLLVTPAVFHYISYFREMPLGYEQPTRILSIGWGGS